MRFLAAATLGLLAAQARVAYGLATYDLTADLTCTSNADLVQIQYTLNGLVAPPASNGVNNNPPVYEVAYRVVRQSNHTDIVSVPVTNVVATPGTGRSDIQNKAFITTNKDNNGAAFVGNTLYQLPGTILHHQQVSGVKQVSGFFEIDTVAAAEANVACLNGRPNIDLVPQQYSFDGLPQYVVNSFDVIKDTAFQLALAAAPAGTPLFRLDVTPAINIDSCYNDLDPAGNPRFRVPFRITKLAVPDRFTELGVLSIAVVDGNNNPSYEWTLNKNELNGQKGFIGQGFLDAAEASIVNWIQPGDVGFVFGKLDFPATAQNVTCNDAGKTNMMLQVIDYSIYNIQTANQTYHFLPGVAANGLDKASQVPVPSSQVNALAAGTPAAQQQAQVPAATKAARKAAAQQACAKAAAAKAAAAAAAAQAAAAAAAGQDAANPCLLTVPPNPLSAQGLATTYILGGGCTMADTAGFVQATIISPSTGKVFAYQPLVVQQGKKALIAPIVPKLPADAVVGLWFGSNGAFQKLVAADPKTLTQANCVNGAVINGKLSLFGQIAACNGANFYSAAAMAIFNGLLTVPPLGNAIDGLACLTLRSFALVDQDVQDNVQTQYILDANGNTALNTVSNLATITAAAKAANKAPPTVLVNPGDNPLLSRFVNPALKCNNWEIPDLSIPGTNSVTAPIGEILAAFKQGAPVARSCAGNPMNLDDNGNLNLAKLNALRVGLAGQNAVASLNQASTASYCKNMVGPNGAQRLAKPVIMQALQNAKGPGDVPKLSTFLIDRFAAAVGPDNLKCGKLVPGLTNPLAAGEVIKAQAAFFVEDALLVGANQPDNQQIDPIAELTGQSMQNTNNGKAFPVAIVAGAIGGVVALIIASIIIFKVVQRKKASNVMATTARECKV